MASFNKIQKHLNEAEAAYLKEVAPKAKNAWEAFISLSAKQRNTFEKLGDDVGGTKKSVVIDGVTYESVTEAAKRLKVSRQTIYARLGLWQRKA